MFSVTGSELILRAVRETYCGSIGVEYMYINDMAQKRWIQSLSSVSTSSPFAKSS